MISFYDGDMKFPREDLPKVGQAAHAVMRDAIACRCPQEVRKIMKDDEQESLQNRK